MLPNHRHSIRCLLMAFAVVVLNSVPLLAKASALQGVTIVKTGVEEQTLAQWETALQENNTPVQLVDSVAQLASIVNSTNLATPVNKNKKWLAIVTYGSHPFTSETKSHLKKLIQHPNWVVLLLPQPAVSPGGALVRWFAYSELSNWLASPPPIWVQTLQNQPQVPIANNTNKQVDLQDDDPLALGLAGKTLKQANSSPISSLDWQVTTPTALTSTPLGSGCEAYGDNHTFVFCFQQKPVPTVSTAPELMSDAAIALIASAPKQKPKKLSTNKAKTPPKKSTAKPASKPIVPPPVKPTVDSSITPLPLIITPPPELKPVFLSGGQLVTVIQKLEAYWHNLAIKQERYLKATTHTNKLKQLSQYKAYTYESMGLLQALGRPFNRPEAQRWIDEATQWQKRYESAYEEHLAPLSEKAYSQAMTAFIQAWSYSYMPALIPETKAVWLDRGLMVKLGSAEALRQYIQLLKRSGFSHIYVETINAGFAQYPNGQALAEQNPLLYGWDPIAVTVQEGHRLGMKVNAWVWCFAVGNERHNKLISQDRSYAGPILTLPEMKPNQLLMSDGAMIPSQQHEFWLSPASQQGQVFLLNAYKEIVSNYAVDGLQLDYIRFPFQSDSQQAGWDDLTKARAWDELGIDLQPNVPLTGSQRDKFNQWKAEQVSQFVQKVSTQLKAIRPNLALSAAVFALPRADRIKAIQQDWETWIQNGWIDTLVPMTYSTSPTALNEQLGWIYKAVEKGSLLTPGLGAHLLEDQGLLQQAWVTKQNGSNGQTWFAASHLGAERLALLKASTNQVPLYQFQLPAEAPSSLTTDTLTVVQQLAAYTDMLNLLATQATSLPNSSSDFVINPNNATATLKVSVSVLARYQNMLESALGDVVYSGQPSLSSQTASQLLKQWQLAYESVKTQVKGVYPYQLFTQQWLLGELKQLNLKVRYTLRRSTVETQAFSS
ncbi:MAG: family 10 glycosylhydrolase [Vampirovibrio sp.]|nr:family 10 glycosylhydrolase [Vampirovibrio sp.]